MCGDLLIFHIYVPTNEQQDIMKKVGNYKFHSNLCGF